MIAITAVLQIITGIVVVFLLYMYYKRSNVPIRGYGKQFELAIIVKQGSIGFVIGACSMGAIWAAILLTDNGTIERNFNLSFSSILLWFICYIVIAIEEEMVFRGFIMGFLRDRGVGELLTILCSSAVFGFAHLGNQGFSLLALFNLAVFGVSFALMYSFSGNLFMSMGMHFSWNFLQAMLGFSVSGYKVPHVVNLVEKEANVLNGGVFGPEAGLFTTIVVAIQILGIFLYYKRKPKSV
ncbi:MAG: CPBP family intramembrane metalloprotease [bacterium]|nr:CPBP family intramembrane metalloprotease [bacterium]